MPTSAARAPSHDRVPEEAVLSGDEDLVRAPGDKSGHALEGHDRIEGGHLDPDDVGKGEYRVERGVVVGHTARGLVQPEGDDRQLPREPLVIADGILRGGKCEDRVCPAPPGFDRHGDVPGPRDDDAVGERLAPGLQDHTPLLGAQVRAPTGMGPDRHARDRLCRHPSGIGALSGFVELGSAEGDGYRGNEAPLQPSHQLSAAAIIGSMPRF